MIGLGKGFTDLGVQYVSRSAQVLFETTDLGGPNWTHLNGVFSDSTNIAAASSTGAAAFFRFYHGDLADNVTLKAMIEVADENTGWVYFHIRNQSSADYTAYVNLVTGALGAVGGAGSWTVSALSGGYWRVECEYPSGSGSGSGAFVQVQLANGDGLRSVSGGDAIRVRRLRLS